MNNNKSKQMVFAIIGVAILTIAVVGVTNAFFNYTRTGNNNTVQTGRIYFNSVEGDAINLENAFPISSEDAATDTTNAKTLQIAITGDTSYGGGLEYLVTATDVHMTTTTGKTVTLTIEVSVTDNNSKTLGTSNNSYYTYRGRNTSMYKVEYDGTLNENDHILVGYIAPNTNETGIDGIINIKAYLNDADILVSDTYNNGNSPTDEKGTPASLGVGKTVLTTTEWSSLKGNNALSFKIKVEAREGTWVKNKTVISSDYSFGWHQGSITSTGEINTYAQFSLNNHYSEIHYFDKVTLDLSDNVMIKIAYYDENGNFLYNDPWKSKEETNWSNGGTEKIIIENSNIRICLADTTLNNTGDYSLTSEELASRFTYEIIELNDTTDEMVLLPDVEKGTENKGFTCTGLAYDENEELFYVGNYGKMLPQDSSVFNTIVKLSRDGNTLLGEIKLYETVPQITQDIQGVAIDYNDNTLWIVANGNGKIYHISKTGTYIGEISYSGGSGIAYDKRTDTLWVLGITSNGGNIKNITKSGQVIKSFAFSGISNPDQLYLDSTNNMLYFSAGANYNGVNYIYKINLDTEEITLFKSLDNSYAIEGIWMKDDLLYVMNDGYYHSAKINSNYMMIYDLR